MNTDKRSLVQDYLPHLRRSLSLPLKVKGQDGVRDVVDVLTAYDLQKTDMDGILEVTSWEGKPDALAGVEPKVKAALTRTFNKESHLTPYALKDAPKKVRRGGGGGGGEEFGETGEGSGGELSEDEEDNDDVTKDAMIKVGNHLYLTKNDNYHL